MSKTQKAPIRGWAVRTGFSDPLRSTRFRSHAAEGKAESLSTTLALADSYGSRFLRGWGMCSARYECATIEHVPRTKDMGRPALQSASCQRPDLLCRNVITTCVTDSVPLLDAGCRALIEALPTFKTRVRLVTYNYVQK